jgi:3-phosphoshikimate 1-carboxyvinyltransferase
LKQLGANISYLENEGFPPIRIKGGTIKGGSVNVNGSVSSQFISALLMIAPLLQKNSEVNIAGEQVSEPYIDMTLSVMKQFGVVVEKNRNAYKIKTGGSYRSTNYTVEGDASSASYLFALAALTQSTIKVTNVSGKSLQSDARFVDILEQMGCKVSKTDSFIEVTGTGKLSSVNVNMQDMPDTAQTLAVVAAFAKGETTITGLKTLQLKETKRINALQSELSKMDIECEAGADYIKIKGGEPKGAFINTYNDHRMAMAFAVAGTRVEGMIIEAPEVVKKSFPTFWATLSTMGINIDTE